MIISTRQTVLSWFALILLTVISVYIGVVVKNYSLFIFTVLMIVFLKGQQITDVFMELRGAPLKWRLLLLSYVILIPLIISLIYIL